MRVSIFCMSLDCKMHCPSCLTNSYRCIICGMEVMSRLNAFTGAGTARPVGLYSSRVSLLCVRVFSGRVRCCIVNVLRFVWFLLSKITFLLIIYTYTVSGKKSLQFFMCNFNKFKVIFIIFGTNHPETTFC